MERPKSWKTCFSDLDCLASAARLRCGLKELSVFAKSVEAVFSSLGRAANLLIRALPAEVEPSWTEAFPLARFAELGRFGPAEVEWAAGRMVELSFAWDWILCCTLWMTLSAPGFRKNRCGAASPFLCSEERFATLGGSGRPGQPKLPAAADSFCFWATAAPLRKQSKQMTFLALRNFELAWSSRKCARVRPEEMLRK